jgi:uncharacterized protein YkwD
MDYSVKEDTIELIFEKIKYFILPSKDNNYKSKFLQSNILLYCVVLLLTLKIVITLISINVPQNIFFADITKATLENFANQTRKAIGLPALVKNLKLDQAAQLKAENMLANNYFAHTSPSGISPWFWFSKVGYNYKYAGENLAIGFYESAEVYNAWLNSPSHKANIINPKYTEIGTAVLSGFGANNAIIVVQEFGSPIPVKPIAKPVKNTITKPVVTTQTATTNTQTIDTKIKTSTDNGQTTVNTQTTDTNIEVTKTNTQVVTNTNEKVLSQSTESQSLIESVKEGSSDVYSKIANSVLYNYNELLQGVVYGVSLVVIGILLTLVLFNFNIVFQKPLVFRAVLLIGLLFTATLVNKDIIVLLIPHQIII